MSRKCYVVCYCRPCVNMRPLTKEGGPFPAAGRQVCLKRYLPGGVFNPHGNQSAESVLRATTASVHRMQGNWRDTK